MEHQERVEYSYDPGTGQFAAKLVRSSRPVVTGWDPSAPEAVERQIGTWEVTPTGTGVAAESGDSAAQAVTAVSDETRSALIEIVEEQDRLEGADSQSPRERAASVLKMAATMPEFQRA